MKTQTITNLKQEFQPKIIAKKMINPMTFLHHKHNLQIKKYKKER